MTRTTVKVFAQHAETGDLVTVPVTRDDDRLIVGTAQFDADQALAFIETINQLMTGALARDNAD